MSHSPREGKEPPWGSLFAFFYRLPPAFWVLAGIAAAYANALPAAFQFDDFNGIVDNPGIHSLQAWRAEALHGIRPLLKLTYAWNWQWSQAPAGFHLANVLIHAVNALLVHRLARRRLGPGPGSLLAALVFALHPVQTEAVTYVSGRSVSLMATAGLLSLETREWPRTGRFLSPACFLAALLVRETALVLPLALLLWDRLGGRSWKEGLRRIRGHAGLAALALLAPMFHEGYGRFFSASLGLRPMATNLFTQVEALGYLASRVVLPGSLNFDPDLRPVPSLDVWHATGALLWAGLACAALARFRPGKPGWAFGTLWFLLLLAPTNSLFPRRDVVSERHLYFALFGICLAAGHLADRAAARFRLDPPLSAALILAFSGILGLSTLMRNRAYRTEVSLWEDTARKSPAKARVHNNLGYAYQLAGRYPEARRAYLRALALDPDHARARANLERLPP